MIGRATLIVASTTASGGAVAAEADHTIELWLIVSNLLVVIASLLVAAVTAKDANKNTRILARLVSALLGKKTVVVSHKHRKEQASGEQA